MTTLSEARKAIYTKFINEWGTSTPYTFDNEQFNSETINGPWVRLSVRNQLSEQESLGPKGRRKYRREGAIMVQCFALADTGMASLDNVVMAVRTVFEGEKFDGVFVDDTVTREVGPDGRWFMTVVESFFHYNQTK